MKIILDAVKVSQKKSSKANLVIDGENMSCREVQLDIVEQDMVEPGTSLKVNLFELKKALSAFP